MANETIEMERAYMKKTAITLAVLLFGAVSVFSAEKLRLVGSDIIGPAIEKDVALIAKAAGIRVDFDMKGTYLALPELMADKCDVAIIVVPRGNKMPEGLTAMPIAYQAALVIVNYVNPIEEISTGQLKQVYSREADPRAKMWQQLGVTDANLRDIMAISTAYSDNMVIEVFKHMALDGTNLGTWVDMMSSGSDAINSIRTNNSAIAIVGKVKDGDGVKVLPVSKTSANKKAYSFRPDSESVSSGDYPITLPFYVVFKPENLNKVKAFVKVLLDDRIAKCIEDKQFYAAPENSRKKSIFELDLSK